MYEFIEDKFPKLTPTLPPSQVVSYLVELAGNEAVQLWSNGLAFHLIPEHSVFAAAISGISHIMEQAPQGHSYEENCLDSNVLLEERRGYYNTKVKNPFIAEKLAQGDHVAIFLGAWLRRKATDWHLSIEIPDNGDSGTLDS